MSILNEKMGKYSRVKYKILIFVVTIMLRIFTNNKILLTYI
jgi:hypothetical protein